MPTIPAPIMALTKLEVAPATVDFFSFVLEHSFLIRRDVPPGVEIWTSLCGSEGAKKGDLGCCCCWLFAIVDIYRGLYEGGNIIMHN